MNIPISTRDVSRGRYVPEQIFTGEQGPPFKWETPALFWIAMQAHPKAWTLNHTQPKLVGASAPLFSPAALLSGASSPA